MANHRHVALGTISFTICFAAWGLIAAFAPHFRETFHLTASQTALLVAIPLKSKACAVYFEKEQNRLECPCHQGSFSIADGSVIQGPPQRALPRVTLENENGYLVAIGMEAESA